MGAVKFCADPFDSRQSHVSAYRTSETAPEDFEKLDSWINEYKKR